MKVADFIPDMAEELSDQLELDRIKWGDTWLQRTREGQEKRTWEVFKRYFNDFFVHGEPIPWMKVIGGALICWIREQKKDVWPL